MQTFDEREAIVMNEYPTIIIEKHLKCPRCGEMDRERLILVTGLSIRCDSCGKIFWID